MHKENLEKYNSEYEKIVNSNDNKKLIFELSINFLNLKSIDTSVYSKRISECEKIVDRALNSARLYIDELIDQNKFEEAENFCKEATSKLSNIDIFGMNAVIKKSHEIEIVNFFEIYNYRIIDRKYIYNAKNKIEEIEKNSENKIYEVLIIFVTIISIIFSFVNGGQVKIFYFKMPAFAILALTIIFSWWIIKIISSKK